MTRWRICAVDSANSEIVHSDGVSMDTHGNIVFLNEIQSRVELKQEIVAILCKGGILARKEED